jgi:hypothetical protein
LFNSKFFFVIVFLTTLALGAALYFQVEEMMKYNLLKKLDKKYLSSTFTGGGATETAPAEDADAEKKESTDTAKTDDKE